ncbi:hypothetical protein [Microbaculum sp. FT89]|uniref:hypothetical protein n=1 Tax=Microbaculum sp. FT89 TaxID=3447298 RepID=UPI003F539854
MTSSNATTVDHSKAHELDDETFMTAKELRSYMNKTMAAKASKDVDAMQQAAKARDELIKTLSQPIELTDERIHEIINSLRLKVRTAVARGDTELLVMRFPSALCSDRGRKINNGLAGWPDTLVGKPRQAYELWRDRLQPAGYRLKAMIVDWPGGMPGDVGFYLDWADATG